MAIVAPGECRERPAALRFLERVVAEENPVAAVALSRRAPVDEQRRRARRACACASSSPTRKRPRCGANVLFFGDELARRRSLPGSSSTTATAWRRRTSRDPALAREGMTALDELTRILGLGNVYSFQT